MEMRVRIGYVMGIERRGRYLVILKEIGGCLVIGGLCVCLLGW